MSTRRARNRILPVSRTKFFKTGLLIVVATVLLIPVYRATSASVFTRVRSAKPNQRGSAAMASRPLPAAPVPFAPSVATFAADCLAPQTEFVLNDTVCAKVTGATSFNRITFVDPSGFIRQVNTITGNPTAASFQIPNTQTSDVGTPGNPLIVDNRGVWRVNVVSVRGFVVDSTRFVVTDPANKVADVLVSKSLLAENQQVAAGNSSTFQIFVANNGPDDAVNVVLTDVVPNNTTFNSFVQTSGPSFTCTGVSAGGTGTLTCTIASLGRGASASFDFAYQVNVGTAPGTLITNTANVSSATADNDTSNNSSTATANVAIGGNGSCTLTCPGDISASANTTDGGGNPGANVHFDAATGDGSCGAITSDHCNDCFFPVGTTVVTTTTDSGDVCTFNVTVTPPGAPSISCPSNVTANADANCQATVTVGNPTASGNNVTVVGTRSDGISLYNPDGTRKNPDAPFAAGTTTITWIAYSHDTPGPYANADDEEAHRTGSAQCTQTITVVDVTPPTISAPNTSASADANCQAAVPDYSTIATVADNCACASSDNSQICDTRQDIRVTQDVPAGTLLGLGAHTIHLTANDGSSNNNGAGNSTTISVTFTVNDTTPPTFTFVPPGVTAYTGPGATTCDTVVSDATIGTPTATDNCGPITITRSPSGNTFPVGSTVITWTAKDGAGNTTTATQTITVIDNTPPTITLNGQTPSLWPPDHKYQTFTVPNFVASVFDNCGGVAVSDVNITKVTSDEAENGYGSGNTLNDIVISADKKSVQLRSEREGGADGRVYTIYFTLTDTHNNSTTVTAQVVVPHNPGEAVVDSGVHYCQGACP